MGYRLYNFANRKVVHSRNVIFNETHFPYKSGFSLRRRVSFDPPKQNPRFSAIPNTSNSNTTDRPLPLAINKPMQATDPNDIITFDKNDAVGLVPQTDQQAETTRYSLRKNPEPSGAFLRQFAHTSEEKETDRLALASSPSLSEMSLQQIKNDFIEFCCNASQSSPPSKIATPNTFKQAVKSPQKQQWLEAMNKEMGMMKSFKVWKLVPRTSLPENTPVITCRWVFRIKLDSQNNVDKFKARLVARGFQQEEGVNFEETFAVTARFKSFRIAAAIAALRGITLEHWDVTSAFLNGTCHEDIYMEQPPGFEQGGVSTRPDAQPKQNLVCKLDRYIYGLRQAGREWCKFLNRCLTKLGFKCLKSDEGVFIFHSADLFCLIVSHVDDLAVGSANDSFKRQLEQKIRTFFEINNLGPLHFYLGVQVNQTGGTITLNQESYVERALERFNLTECNPKPTPASSSQKLSKSDCPISDSQKHEMSSIPYRSLIGTLMYAVVGTRPEISYIVGALSRFLNNPGHIMWRAGKRALRFLSGTRTASLTYKGNGNIEPVAYVDSDWGNNPDDRRSITGFVLLLGGAAIIWKSRVQQTVALSSVEAEYLALSDCVKEIIWLRSFLTELGFPLKNPTTVYIDSTGAEALAKNPVNHQRTKHIDIRHHFIREHVEAKTIGLVHITSHNNVADIFTKPLPHESFNRHHATLIGAKINTFGQKS